MEHIASQNPTFDTFDEQNHMRKIEECLCLGIWVYRVIMLRSVPPEQSQCISLASNLQAALLKTDINIEWRDHYELLLWITFMGANAMSDGLLRRWYAELLKLASTHLGIFSWEDSREVLRNFLWVSRCESLGRAVWTDVENC